MAGNRFKKSIEKAEINTQSTIEINPLDDDLKDNKETFEIENTSETIETTQNNDSILENTSAQNDISDISNILNKVLTIDKKNKGGNHTIYLSAEVGSELLKLSKKTKKSKSQIVDEILSMVFFQK